MPLVKKFVQTAPCDYHHGMTNNWWLSASILALAMAMGCSPFNRQWKSMADAPPPAEVITGRWQGHWYSEPTGHNGRLRCIVQRQDDCYEAWFHAVFAGCFTFKHRMTLEAEPEEEWIQLHGEEGLGALAGGRYQYEGRANGQEFHLTYRASKDYGYFILHRPE